MIYITLLSGEIATSLYKELIEKVISDMSTEVEILVQPQVNDKDVIKVKKGYVIKHIDDAIYVSASNSEMLFQALTSLKNKLLISLNGCNLKDVDEQYCFPERDEYIKDIELFTPVWKYVWTPPKWLMDYEEKKTSFSKANRPMCWAHRGGGEYYPENSIEAIISSIKMGADIMELDFRYTKDKKIILMHYDTLHQSTDWEEKHGKNGLPESDYVADWNYEEILQLRLKAGRLFNPEIVTEYIVPTLEEVLYVCNRHVFFVMDKMNPYKEWEAVLDCIERTGCYEAFAFAYQYPEEEARRVQEEMLLCYGATGPWFYDRRHSGSLERECLSEKERLKVFEEFSEYDNAAIMTNYVQELVLFIDERYGGDEGDK